jgi:hypothetical protein
MTPPELNGENFIIHMVKSGYLGQPFSQFNYEGNRSGGFRRYFGASSWKPTDQTLGPALFRARARDLRIISGSAYLRQSNIRSLKT